MAREAESSVRPRERPKTAGDENFPVASLLIAREDRPVVRAYYRMARRADDIADDPDLCAEEKLRRLDGIDAALTASPEVAEPSDPDRAVAARAGKALSARAIPVEHATRLLRAFRRDAVQGRTADWQDLMGYCADSAAPVGRFLLDLHGESPANRDGSDALCAALQVLNHLQDIGDDYRRLDRIYLPADWLAAEGVAEATLRADRSTPGLRRVLDRCLVEVEALLVQARPLASRLRSTRLALETAVILALARALAHRLAVGDPLATGGAVPKPAMLAIAMLTIPACLWRRALNPGLRAGRLTG